MNDNNGPRTRLNEYGVMLSQCRVQELLDYATNYGEFDQNTVPGTPYLQQPGDVCSAEQCGAISAYMRVLGILRTPV